VKTILALWLCLPGRAETIAAVPFLSVGVSDDDAAALAGALATEAARRTGARLSSARLAGALLDDCPENPACLRALAEKLSADTVLLTVTTAPKSGPLVLSVSRADSDGRIVARVQAVVPADPAGRALALERMAHALLPAPMLAKPAPRPVPRPTSVSPPPRAQRRWLWIAAGAAAVVGTSLALLATRDGDHPAPRTETLPPQTLGSFGPGSSGR